MKKMMAYKVSVTEGLRRLSTLNGYDEKFCKEYYYFDEYDAKVKAKELDEELFKEYGGFSGIDVNVNRIEIN